MRKRLYLLGLLAYAVNAPTYSSDLQNINPSKATVLEYLENAATVEKYGRLSDNLWSFPELGMQEFRSSQLLIQSLTEAGFQVEEGLAGMPTCFVATYGQGKPVIGIMAEFDALPEISQKGRVPYHDPVLAGGPGHGCGHNMMGTASIAGAIAVKHAMEKHQLVGTIKVFGSPAEETLISRPYMVRAGLFNGVDAIIDNHADSKFSTYHGTLGTAMYSTVFTFKGKTAHSAEAPWSGRSALDAVELMNIATNYLREHLHYAHRMHYVIVKGGEAPNVVPDRASVWYFVRDTDERLAETYERVINCARGAALASGTELEEIQCLTAIHQIRYNKAMAEIIQQNIEMIGIPAWDDEEVAFAISLQRNLGAEEQGMPNKVSPLLPAKEVFVGGGSSDIGDVTRVAPTAPVFFPGVVPGAIWHHWSLVSCTYGSAAWKGLMAGAKTIAASAIDLMTQPAMLESVKSEFMEFATQNPYTTFLPEDALPPLELNSEGMKTWRPLLENQ